ncbi:TIGR04282 family arsenosugar biosynthesis glycosyltransferase [Nonomuraea sp. ZG12]|uniref:TIGR04282 family arsenosugar biosynthesis glycosyltransferase n=1 Tax=Nonomuraea sp. ZG12 TaxID=3452207 RepID=UPI003F8B448F
MTNRAQIVVLAKRPVPGRVKTRLTPPHTPGEAAALAAACLQDTLAAVAATPAAGRVLAVDDPRLTAPGFSMIEQRGDGLDERLAWAFQDAYAADPAPVVLIGMDTPQITPALLSRAGEALDEADAVFGPASDGGYWLLGLRVPDPALLLGVPMSQPCTGEAQLRRLRDAGLRVASLPRLTDVDDAATAREVAATAPDTHFAATLASLGSSATSGLPYAGASLPAVPPGTASSSSVLSGTGSSWPAVSSGREAR